MRTAGFVIRHFSIASQQTRRASEPVNRAAEGRRAKCCGFFHEMGISGE
jgi:hypothetical protein